MVLISLLLWVFSLTTFLVLGSLYLLLVVFISPRHLHGIARIACRAILFTAETTLSEGDHQVQAQVAAAVVPLRLLMLRA